MERDRVRERAAFDVDHAITIVPVGEDRAALVVVRGRLDGGVVAAVGIGRAVTDLVPGCFCDACDEDSASMIERAEQHAQAVSAGFVEFRRRHRVGLRQLLFSGPSMEVGFSWKGGRVSVAGIDIMGDPFEQRWRPWRLRDGRG